MEGIHTALETSGYAPLEIFSEVSALADLLLFDIKHYDERCHIEGTGVDISLILSNLKNALSRNAQVILRLPLIPGFNNLTEDASGFASMFKSIGSRCTPETPLQVQLLPFHQFGEKKYDLLNTHYSMRGVPQLQKEDFEEFRQIIADDGMNCFF